MPLPKEQHYTYADLLAWDDGIRYELYDGQPVAMASPSDVHQAVSGEIFRQIANYLVGKKCKVYSAPFDVRLFETEKDAPDSVDTVLQPDLMVVCDPNKVDHRGIHGAPNMIVEVLSSSTARYDKLLKFNLYQQAGVPEYWIVDPVTRTVSVYSLEDGAYHAATIYGADSVVPVGALDACEVDLSTVFPADNKKLN
jgi:Uma2 family endonuclease